MNVLALEASTDLASVALWLQGALHVEDTFSAKRTLSSDLFPRLWRLVENSGPIDRIVVGLGPGSYAGVRITIAAALGLQSVWGCELVGIPSVVGLGPIGESFRVVGDARRGTWYFSRVASGVCVEGPKLLEDSGSLAADLALSTGPVYATESAGGMWGELLKYPQASILAELGARDVGVIQRGQLEPLYLREAHITRPKS